MADPKRDPTEESPPAALVNGIEREVQAIREARTSYIRPNEGGRGLEGAGAAERSAGSQEFLDEWALRHFTISVRIHDVERLGELDPERRLVLEDLSLVQGILLELHDFASSEERVQALMDRGLVLQNGVSALYAWLEEVLDAASHLGVTRGRPSFVDAPDAEVFAAILRSLERVHPDLEGLLRVEAIGVEPDVAQKLALCFRQIGAAVVRVSGRTVSSYPPQDR